MEFQGLGKYLIIIGVVVLVVGIFISLGGKIPLLGKLPGDIHIKRENFSFYFPLGTSILLSIGLSLLFFLFNKFFR